MCNLEAGRGMAVGLVGSYTFTSACSKLLATAPTNDNSRSCGGLLQPPTRKLAATSDGVPCDSPHKSNTLLLSTLSK